mmetsp:Transcript_22969/g.34839  ORF Transcript_22969/g.34839 Transcript_22969/m.34839 type:complete len:1014 (+) Transcript_22969:77-3118(+)
MVHCLSIIVSGFLLLTQINEAFLIYQVSMVKTTNRKVIKTILRSTKPSKKKNLPESELINRRKSPALWRNDLTLKDFDKAKTNNVEESHRHHLQRPPEVMAPCGGFPQLKAAIANGADSVYLGLSAFSARARASNFNPSQLVKAVHMAHTYGVRVFVALNTLVFQNELPEVAAWLSLCDQVGVDAVIVQDIGVTQLAKKIVPNLEIHASTQQSITNADGVMHASQRGGANRVVLGRELSVEQIESVTKEIGKENDVEVEAFVHGALCVSYSGQCFSSEAWGGRSANRGQCAQACRLPYGLVRNGELTDLQDMSYLLSPQDLCGLDQVEDLIRAGVSCLKIEGRLKDEKYVAATTRAYRNAVDLAWEKIMQERGEEVVNRRRVLDAQKTVTKAELTQLFARGQDEFNDGLSPGFFEGSQHQSLVIGRSPRHRGVHIGRVAEGSSFRNGLIIQIDDSKSIDSALKRGDGIVVDRGLPQEDELGGPIFEVEQINKKELVVRFSRGVEKKWRITDDASKRGLGTRKPLAPAGAHVWKTSDSLVDKKMKNLIEAAPPRKMVQVTLEGGVGTPLTVVITDLTTGARGIGLTEGELILAEQEGLDKAAINKAIGKLGNTDLVLADQIDTSKLEDGIWCPISWVKKARQKAVENLKSVAQGEGICQTFYDEIGNEDEVRISNAHKDFVKDLVVDACVTNSESDFAETKLSVLARNPDQVDALCELSIADKLGEVVIDFLEVEGMARAVSKVRQAGLKVLLASPRIIKPGEEGIWRTLLRLKPDGLLIRSSGLVHRMMKLGGTGATVEIGDGEKAKIPELIGDFSLNTVNSLTAKEFLDTGGLSRITASYELNSLSITGLAQAMGPSRAAQLEVIAHAHLPIFHTEHCVFARFLSKGNSYLDCGHVCTHNKVHLRDLSGNDNLVLADMGCRNTVFSSEAQSGVHSIQEWANAGVGCIRIELVDEAMDDVRRIVEGYHAVLSGSERASRVWDLLKEVKDSNGRYAGVSHGSYRNTRERRAGEL